MNKRIMIFNLGHNQPHCVFCLSFSHPSLVISLTLECASVVSTQVSRSQREVREGGEYL